MSFDVSGLFNAVESHAAASGLFERVNTHEPKNAPGNGLTAAVWVDRVWPVRSSGLASTSALVVLMVRIFTNMISEPQDAIDPNITAAVGVLFDAYSGDFELGGTARQVDLLGQTGTPLSAQAGYVEQDHKLFRVITITVPIIVNDAHTQAA